MPDPSQNIVISFESDTSGLQPGVEQLQQLGQVDKDLSTAFTKTNDALNQRQKLISTNDSALQKYVQDLLKVEKATAGAFGVKGLQDFEKTVKSSADSMKLLQASVTLAKQNMDKFRPNTPEWNQLNDAVKQGEALLKAYGQTQDQAVTKQTNFRTQIRQTTQDLAQQLTTGKITVAQLYEQAKGAGILKDAYTDASRAITALSSDTFKLDAVIQGVQTLAAGYQLVAGAEALFGSDNENLQATLVKLNAVMAITNGIQQIYMSLQKESGIVLAAQIVWDKTLAAANIATAATYKFLGIAVEESSLAFTTLKAAIITTGIGALIVAIGFLVEKMTSAKKSAEDLTNTQFTLSDAVSESANEFKNAYVQVETLKEKIDLAKQGFIDKSAVVKEYNETIGKTTGSVKSLDEAETALVKNADAYIRFTLLKAAANIALQKAAQKAFEAAQAQLSNESIPKQIQENASKISQGTLNALGELATAINNKTIASANKQKDDLLQITNDLLSQAEAIAKQFGFKFSSDVITATSKTAQKQVEATIAAAITLFKRDPEIEAAMKEEQDRLLKAQQDADQARIAAAESAVQDRVNRTNQLETEGQNRLAQQYLNGEITFEEFEKQKAQIAIDATKKSIDEQIRMYQALLNDPALSPEKRAEIEQKITDLNKEAYDLDVENHKSAEEQKTSDSKAQADARQKIEELAIQTVENVFQIIAGGNQALYDQEIQNIQDLKDKKLISEEEAQKRINAIRRKAAADEKALAIFSALISQSQAVLAVLADKTIPSLIKPFVIAATIAAAVSQIALIASRPLPNLYRGTKKAKEGAYRVGELGMELMWHKDTGFQKLGERGEETAYIPEGARVFTAPETHKILESNMTIPQMNDLPEWAINQISQVNIDYDKLGDIIATKITEKQGRISDIPQTGFTWDEDGIREWQKKKDQRDIYLNKYRFNKS